MRNYQLYRTNVLLGGQMQLDLVLGKKNSKYLQVNNAHISPISSYVPFTYSPDENILLYTHQDNIREYYKKIEGSFYQTFLTPELTHDWPIIYHDENDEPKQYNDTYMYGCRRLPLERYGEQFGVLVPVWIEEIKDNIQFVINLYGVSKNTEAEKPFASMTLNLEKKDGVTENSSFDDRFSAYMFNYFDYVGLGEVDSSVDKSSEDGPTNDNIINIVFNKSAYVHGLECTSGNVVTKDISPLASNITFRERPLMEVDNMIINCFKDNHMICKQLFNFNLCFSLADFIPTGIFEKDFFGELIRVSVDVYVDGLQVAKKDFFNNYEDIRVESLTVENGNNSTILISSPGPNVINYLSDNYCLDLMNKNKLSPSIIHWSLNGQNDYIFNVYGGFGGKYYTKVFDTVNFEYKTIETSVVHDYGCYTSDFYGLREQDITNANWLNFMSLTDITDILYHQPDDLSFLKGFVILRDKMTKFDDSTDVVHGSKYDKEYAGKPLYILATQGSPSDLPGRKIATVNTTHNDVVVGDVDVYDLLAELPEQTEDEPAYLAALRNIDMYLLVVRKTINSLYFSDFVKALHNVTGIPQLDQLAEVMDSAIEPTKVQFNRSISKMLEDSPFKAKEFRYYKNDININKYLNRYDGKISPTFIDIEGDSLWKNNFYYKKAYIQSDWADKDKENPFRTYGGSKYQPLYQSIGYFATTHAVLDESLYNTPEVSDVPDEDILHVKAEHPWFDHSKVFYLKPELNLVIKNAPVMSPDEFDQAVKAELVSVYGEEYIDDIYNMYEVKYDWEYSSLTDINTYDYNVAMKLK